MKLIPIVALLTLAALLEVGGDALMRNGLQSSGVTRLGWMLVGVLVLGLYGVLVNLGPWDFGRVIGVYVTLVFLAAQGINFFTYGIRPSLAVWVGGGLVIAGGLVLALFGK